MTKEQPTAEEYSAAIEPYLDSWLTPNLGVKKEVQVPVTEDDRQQLQESCGSNGGIPKA